MKNKRDFLKALSLSALSLSLGKVFSPLSLAAKDLPSYEKGEKAKEAKSWAMVIDCQALAKSGSFAKIISACHKAHNVPEISGKQEVKWIWTDNFAQSFPDEASPYLPERVLQGEFLLLCNHCEEPSCVPVCPTGATFKNAEGIVMMDPHRCIGCRYCMAACPYGARSFNFKDPRPFIKELNPHYPARMRGVVEKCTFCPERLALGELPYCVEASEGAILFGDLQEPNSPVRKALNENGGRVPLRRKVSLGTEPKIFYLL